MTGLFLLVTVVFWVFVWGLSRYLQARGSSNVRLRESVEQFHSAADKLLKTPDDLPDEVMKMIGAMSRTAFLHDGPFHLFKHVRHLARGGQSGTGNDAASEEFDENLRSLRPELQMIVKDLASSWLSIVVNNNVLFRYLIRRELDHFENHIKRTKKVDEGHALGQQEGQVSERLLSLCVRKSASLSLFVQPELVRSA